MESSIGMRRDDVQHGNGRTYVQEGVMSGERAVPPSRVACTTSSLATEQHTYKPLALQQVPSTAAAALPPHDNPRSLFNLDEDVLYHICSFVPLEDLILRIPLTCKTAQRRIFEHDALWQRMWIRYVMNFVTSLVPLSKPAVHNVNGTQSTPAKAAALWASETPDVEGVLDVCPYPKGHTWRLYHFHHSHEIAPRVEKLERLRVLKRGIADPETTAPLLQGSGPCGSAEEDVATELLRFAQACAAYTGLKNLSHTSRISALGGSQGGGRGAAALRIQHRSRRGTQRQWQRERLQRVLHFLLSFTGSRPRLEDPLWTATRQADDEYRLARRTAAHAHTTAGSSTRAARHLALSGSDPASAFSALSSSMERRRSVLARERSMSWLDYRGTTVKVLLLGDDTRSTGDAVVVQEEERKLLKSIAHNWRIAYSSQLYLSVADGMDEKGPPVTPAVPLTSTLSANVASPAHHRNDESGSNNNNGGGGGLDGDRRHRHSVHRMPEGRPSNGGDRRAAWALVYLRWANSGRGGGGPPRADAESIAPAPDRTRTPAGNEAREAGGMGQHAVLPSSGNPLFDLHLLGYETRKQLYAAVLANTVEVPDGFGVFFGICVSELFSRKWGWPNEKEERKEEDAAAVPALPQQRSGTEDERIRPHAIWVVQALPPVAGNVHGANVGDVCRHVDTSEEAAAAVDTASVIYSSSYSDVTSRTTASGDEVPVSPDASFSSSSSILFTLERDTETNRDAVVEGREVWRAPQAPVDGTPFPIPTAAALRPASPHLPSPPTPAPVAALFPLEDMLTYWFLLHHVTFFSHQVYRRVDGDQEVNVAVCSRILSPTGHSVECRFFYSLRCAMLPRMFIKMMFTPSVLPAVTVPEKMRERSPYRSSNSDASSCTSSGSAASEQDAVEAREEEGGRERRAASDTGAEDLVRGERLSAPPPTSAAESSLKPVDSRQVYDLFWTGFGRVEVELKPAISRSNFLRLRIALGLPTTFSMGLLWNAVMFASGIGPLVLQEHRYSLLFSYQKTFTDVAEDVFGDVECYGWGARPPSGAGRGEISAAGHPRMEPTPSPAVLERQVSRSLPSVVDTSVRVTTTGDTLTAASFGEWAVDSQFSSSVEVRSAFFSGASESSLSRLSDEDRAW